MSARRFLAASALGVLLFPVALLLHELAHVAVLYALGDSGRLIVRDWSFTFLPLTLPSLHAQAAHPLALVPHLVFDFAGPALAVVPFALLASTVPGRSARAALLATAGGLAFFALIEPLDLVFDGYLGAAPQFLLWAEFNYGLPLAIILGAALAAALPPGDQEWKAGRPAEAPAEPGQAVRANAFEQLN